jgi:methionine aminotransferase
MEQEVLDKVQSKLPNVKTTIFTVMSKMANDHNAINLSQGFPDFPIDSKLAELVTKAMKDGFNQYSPMQGLPSLREAIAKKLSHTCQLKIDVNENIVVTAGATQAIFTAISALVHKGDEVVLFAPAYDCYAPAVELFGAKPVYCQLKAPDYQVDWDEVRSKVNSKTRLIIINTPHNPTGTVLSAADMKELEKIVLNSNAYLLSDEVYEHIVFDGHKHQSAALFPDLYKRSLIVASFGKTFHVTGWKLGYIYGPEYLMKEYKKVHQYNVFCVNTPMQVALSEYVSHPENYEKIPDFYQRKRDVFLDAVKGSQFTFTPAQGTYFQILNYENISDMGEVEFAEELTKKYKVASIPLSVFYSPELNQHTLRFCFAKNEETLKKAGEILKSITA